MQTPYDTNTTATMLIKPVISNWELQNTRLFNLLKKLPDEILQQQVAPNRNSGVYIIGHLAAVSDGMLPLLELGNKLHPGLQDIFIDNSDNSGLAIPAVAELKKYLAEINTVLREKFNQLAPGAWLEKHAAITAEDFEKEPFRNKLNVLINRTIHQGYHIGQLIFLKN